MKNDICRNYLDESTFATLMQSNSFKYFAMNGNTLFALNELPITVNNGALDERRARSEVLGRLGMPAVILLCRGLFGKNVWTLNFRYNAMSNRVRLLRSMVRGGTMSFFRQWNARATRMEVVCPIRPVQHRRRIERNRR